ncbi:type II secretion system secretin GspD [Inquilinus sp. NPDC058860]|uniref:type II secretion system secretin GspD n=1 Tax=Inquilinus sp. NPDC058860 TaxID=3346652 RepID=UPI0036B93115
MGDVRQGQAARSGRYSALISMLVLMSLAGCDKPPPVSTSMTVDQAARASFDAPARFPKTTTGSVSVAQSPNDLRAPQLYFGAEAAVSPAVQTTPVTVGSEGTQINFENADIRDFLKAVLTDTLKVSYTVDARVQGTATVSTSRPLNREDLLATVETVLRSDGAAMIPSGSDYRIVPANEASGGRVAVQLGPDPTPLPAGYGVTIIPLRYVQAATVAPLISPVANSNVVRVDPTRNIIVLAGPSSDRTALAEMIASFDIDAMKGVSAGLFPLHRSDPASLIQELRSVFSQGQGNSAQTGVDFLPIRRLNAILVVTRQPGRLRQAETWINRLDQGDKQGKQIYVYQVENGTAENLASILSQFFGGGSARTSAPIGESSTVAPGLQPQTVSSEGAIPSRPGGGAPADSSSVMSAGEKLGILSNDLNATLAGDGGTASGRGQDGFDGAQVVADKERNALLVMATPQAWRKIEAAIRMIDLPRYQVLIQATIAEVQLNNTLRYGVHYFLENGNFSSIFTRGNGFSVNPTVPGFNFIISSGNFNVVLDALSSVTNVKVVSSPSLAVLDNQTAELKVGDQVPVITREQQSTDNPDAPLVNNVEYRDTGVKLEVTPRISPDGQVTLDLRQEVSNVVRSDSSTAINPTISQREVGTTVSVASGQTVILGGLISDSQNASNAGIPVLRDIPLVGNLFSDVDRSHNRTELVIMMTPKVIRNAADAKAVADEVRSQMQIFGAGGKKP